MTFDRVRASANQIFPVQADLDFAYINKDAHVGITHISEFISNLINNVNYICPR